MQANTIKNLEGFSNTKVAAQTGESVTSPAKPLQPKGYHQVDVADKGQQGESHRILQI